MLIFTVILASTLLLASFGLMSVTEPSCERRRQRREPDPAPIRVAVRPSFAGSGWRSRSARRSPRAMSLAQLYRAAQTA